MTYIEVSNIVNSGEPNAALKLPEPEKSAWRIVVAMGGYDCRYVFEDLKNIIREARGVY